MTLRCIKGLLPVVLAALLIVAHIAPAACAPFKASKSVKPMDDGNFLIKVKITSTEKEIYCVKLIDADESIIDVYAPKGWCIATDGGTFVARTNGKPVKVKRSTEFIIHSELKDVSFTCTVFGLLEQIGLPGTI
jgi:hypothetical protein